MVIVDHCAGGWGYSDTWGKYIGRVLCTLPQLFLKWLCRTVLNWGILLKSLRKEVSMHGCKYTSERGVHIHSRSQDWEFGGMASPSNLCTSHLGYQQFITKLVVAFLWKKRIHIILYINDNLILADSKQKSTLHLLQTLKCMSHANSIAQLIEFQGFLVNFLTMTIALPPEKNQEAQVILDSQSYMARQAARIMGLLSSAILAVILAPLYHRSDFECVLNDCEWCYTSQIVILMVANCQVGKPHPEL